MVGWRGQSEGHDAATFYADLDANAGFVFVIEATDAMLLFSYRQGNVTD
jgi:hypothetical protein